MRARVSDSARQQKLSGVSRNSDDKANAKVVSDARRVPFSGFMLRKEDLTRNRRHLSRIESLRAVDKQFIATLIDTEAAIGYFLRKFEHQNNWTAYISVKMVHSGVVNHFAELLGLERRRRPWEGSINSLETRKGDGVSS